MKHDDEELQKVKKVLRMKHKTESASEKKWGALLKMVPKATKEMKLKDNQMKKSVNAESPSNSENIPEIKISRVQTSGSISSKQKKTSKSSEPAESNTKYYFSKLH